MTDFRYNTGETRVPWSAVGENYNLEDIMTLIQFLIKGEGAEYEKLLESTKTNISELLKIGAPPGKLSLGKLVETLEGEIDKFLKTNNSTFITNATAGFEIAYRYATLGPGDEVIAPAITFIATVSYPLAVGAKVIFADVDPLTLNMDPEDVRKKITDKTKMIVPVHLGGWPVDMDPIMKLAIFC